MFDDPVDAAPSWNALHEVLRDQSRNMLFDYLGLGEDAMKIVLRPDCADLPYFLRAYFAFKMGLPFGYSKCSRGGGGNAPRCPQWFSVQNLEGPAAPPSPPPTRAAAASMPTPRASSGLLTNLWNRQVEEAPSEPVAVATTPAAPAPRHLGLAQAFGEYSRTVGNGVHSGSGRTALNDNN